MKLPINDDNISIKSKIGVEYRRYALKKEDVRSFETFYEKIESFHQLKSIPFVIFYIDSQNFLLPINNDDNLAKAITSAKQLTVFNYDNISLSPNSPSTTRSNNNHNNNNNNNIINYYSNHQNNNYNNTGLNYNHSYFNFYNNNNSYNFYSNNNYDKRCSNPNTPTTFKRRYLRIFIEKKGVFLDYYNGNLRGKYKKSYKAFSSLLMANSSNEHQNFRPSIGVPEDFRQVSSIIDHHIMPETCRRVKIVKYGSDKPLGFYIRDGEYRRKNAHGRIEIVTGVFISRLVPGGLAESTGLLGVNDEVLEVNGMQVTHGKTLDQVSDMMVANSSNLILTIRTNQPPPPSPG